MPSDPTTINQQTRLQAYEQLKFELADVIRNASTLAREAKAAEVQSEYQELAVRLAEDQFNLAVVGQFSRGKTSLMNAVLGVDRLPTGVVPLTSVITTVRYGTRECVLLHYEHSALARKVTLADLPQYVTQIGNPENRLRIRLAEVQLPADILRRGFFFVDTPGLGSAIAANTATTENFLPEMDAVVLVTSCEGPLSKDEVAFLKSAYRQSRKVFLVINKIDLLSDRDRAEVSRYAGEVLREVGMTDLPVFILSARDGLLSKLGGDPAVLARCGLPEFEQELVRFLTTEKSRSFLARICERIRYVMTLPGRTEETESLLARVENVQGQLRDGSKFNASQSVATVAGRHLRLNQPCPVCVRTVEAVFNFLSRYQYDLSRSRDEQAAHAKRGGFCVAHTWQYEQLASPRGVCTSYPLLLQSVARRLASLVGTTQSVPEMARAVSEATPNHTDCSACAVRAAAEERAIADLLTELQGTADAAIPLLCLPHLHSLLVNVRDVGIANRLFDCHARAYEETAANMQRFVLRQDARRRDLFSDEERQAHELGLMLLVGHKRAGA